MTTRVKRPRLELDETASTSSQLLDGINIVDDSSSPAKFIKLINNSSRDVSMSGWILKRRVGSQSFEFKLPRGMNLKAGATSTVGSLLSLVTDVEFSSFRLDLEFRCERHFRRFTDEFEITNEQMVHDDR